MSFNYYNFTIIFLASLLFSFFITRLAILVSNKIGFVNNPNPIVETHKYPIPYGGGISIALTIILIISFCYGSIAKEWLFFLIIPVTIIGSIDDALKLSPLKKIILEILSLIPFCIYLNVPGHIAVVFLLFLLSVQNAWNLIDIMDGLTAGISIIAFLAITIITFFDKRLLFYSLLSLVSAFSTLGFRMLNKYPARIFLGDTGSLLLGSVFAFIVIGVFFISKVTAGFLILLAGIPFFELFFLIIVRTKKGIPFYRGSPDHFALRMLNKGITVKKINTWVLSISLIHSLIIILLSLFDSSGINLLIAILITLLGAGIAYHYFAKLPAKII